MVRDQVLSGWTTSNVWDLKQELKIVTTMVGELTVVAMKRICLSAAFLVKRLRFKFHDKVNHPKSKSSTSMTNCAFIVLFPIH